MRILIDVPDEALATLAEEAKQRYYSRKQFLEKLLIDYSKGLIQYEDARRTETDRRIQVTP